MPVDAELRPFLEMVKDAPPLHSIPFEFLRQNWPIPSEPPPAVRSVVNRVIETNSARLPVRIYRASQDRALPLLVYFHGGGFTLGNLEVCDSLLRQIALNAECLVISVDYRLAPEHPFPAAVEDACGALAWAREYAAELGGDPRRVVVGGDSAGANLATVAAQCMRDEAGSMLAGQLLINPVTVLRAPKGEGSMLRNGEHYFLRTGDMAWFEDCYLGSTGDARDPRASPLLADLRQLPPALIIAAEFDPLLDQAEAYARRLTEAGVDCTYSYYAGAIHTFVGMPAAIGRRALAEACAWLTRTASL